MTFYFLLTYATLLLPTLIDPPHLSPISLISTVWFPVSLHLQPPSISLVLYICLCFPLPPFYCLCSVLVLTSLLLPSCHHPAFLCLSPVLMCSPCSAFVFPLDLWLFSVFVLQWSGFSSLPGFVTCPTVLSHFGSLDLWTLCCNLVCFMSAFGSCFYIPDRVMSARTNVILLFCSEH